jgi:hypothetical protein
MTSDRAGLGGWKKSRLIHEGLGLDLADHQVKATRMRPAMAARLRADLGVACADVPGPGQRDGAEAGQGDSENENAAERPGVRDSRRGNAVSTSRRPPAAHLPAP